MGRIAHWIFCFIDPSFDPRKRPQAEPRLKCRSERRRTRRVAGRCQRGIIYRHRGGKCSLSVGALALRWSRLDRRVRRRYMGNRNRCSFVRRSTVDRDRRTRTCRSVGRSDVGRNARWHWGSTFHRLDYVSRRVDDICRGVSGSGRSGRMRHRFSAWGNRSGPEMVRPLQHRNGTDSSFVRYDYPSGRRLALAEQRRGKRDQLRMRSTTRSGLLPVEPMVTSEMR